METKSRPDIAAISSSVQSAIVSAQLALQHWKEIDLDAKRKAWEDVTLEVANAQEASSTSRKSLAESTKGFKKLTDEEKLQQWGTLLKSYQGEIDSLTKRSKSAEMHFLNCYKALKDVPEPSSILGTLSEELQNVPKLKESYEKAVEELNEYKTEFQGLKNQDVTIRRLEEKIRTLEDEKAKELTDSVAEAVEAEQKAMESQIKVALDEYKKRELELQAQIKQAKQEVSDLQKRNDELQSSQMESESRLEAELSAKQAQIDILSEEVDRAASNGAALEREKEQINSQYLDLWKKHYANAEGNTTSVAASATAKVAELETALQSKDGRVKQLTLQVEILEESLQKERNDAQQVSEEHLKQLRLKETEIAELKRQIEDLPTHADMRALQRQLRVLQAVEYGMADTLDAELDEDEAYDTKSGLGGETLKLEEMLLAKNKKLESKLTEIKRLLDSKSEEIKVLQEREAEADRRGAEKTAELVKLEKQLFSKTDPEKQGFSPDHLSALLQKPAGESESTDPSLLAAVTQQRDRLRVANSALESESAALKKRISSYESEIRTLRDDNVKMYEKIKFLESYKPSQQGTHVHTVDMEASIDSMPNSDKYKAMYEESINPFTVFNQKQRALRRERMDFSERIMYEASQFFLGNTNARKFVFFYMVFMHLLVFITLYRVTHKGRDPCKRAVHGGAVQADKIQASQQALKEEHGTGQALKASRMLFSLLGENGELTR